MCFLGTYFRQQHSPRSSHYGMDVECGPNHTTINLFVDQEFARQQSLAILTVVSSDHDTVEMERILLSFLIETAVNSTLKTRPLRSKQTSIIWKHFIWKHFIPKLVWDGLAAFPVTSGHPGSLMLRTRTLFLSVTQSIFDTCDACPLV